MFMTRGNCILALALLVLVLGGCTSQPDTHSNGDDYALSISVNSPVDPVIQRQRALEAKAKGIANEVIWSFRTGEGETFTCMWPQGSWLLGESYNAQSKRYSIHAIDLIRGRQEWLLEIGDNRLARAPHVGEGTIAFLTENDGGMVVVNARTGGRIFHKRTRVGVVPASDAMSKGDTIYLSNYVSERIAAIAASDGLKGWDFRTNGTCRTVPVLTRGQANQYLIFGTDEGHLAAVSAKRYDEVAPVRTRWEKVLHGGVVANPKFTLVGEGQAQRGLVVVPCDHGWLYGVEPATGRSRWVLHTNSSFTSDVQIMNGKVFAKNGERLFCLDALSGDRVWHPKSSTDMNAFDKTQHFGSPEGYETAHRALAANDDRVFLLRGANFVMRCAAGSGQIDAVLALPSFDFFISNEASDTLILATNDGYFMALK